MPERVGFIGLGIMGRGMAANLVDGGHDLIVHNRTAERMRDLADRGAETADSPRELAMAADIIITCVSDTPDVDHVLFGPDGVAAGVRPGSLVIDMSTISPAATRFFATRLPDGVDYLDAPVSGGSEGAARGTLNIMVGGADAALTRAMPYLDAMGSKITHVGPVGAGQTCKLVNQILVVVNMLGVAEGLLLAEAGGLDLRKTIEAVSGGAAGSWMLDNRAPQVIERYWKPGFTIDLQQKDLRLVLETADAAGVPLVGTGLVSQLYRTLQRAGEGGDGNHALVKALERLSGVTIGAEPPAPEEVAAEAEVTAPVVERPVVTAAPAAAPATQGPETSTAPSQTPTEATPDAATDLDTGPAAVPDTPPPDTASNFDPIADSKTASRTGLDPGPLAPDLGLPAVGPSPTAPELGSGLAAESDTDPGSGPAPGLGTGFSPRPAPDLAMGPAPELGPRPELGTDLTADPGPELGTDLTPGPGPELGTDYVRGPAPELSIDPDSGPAPEVGPGIGTGLAPGQRYAPRPTSDEPGVRPAPETGSGSG